MEVSASLERFCCVSPAAIDLRTDQTSNLGHIFLSSCESLSSVLSSLISPKLKFLQGQVPTNWTVRNSHFDVDIRGWYLAEKPHQRTLLHDSAHSVGAAVSSESHASASPFCSGATSKAGRRQASTAGSFTGYSRPWQPAHITKSTPNNTGRERYLGRKLILLTVTARRSAPRSAFSSSAMRALRHHSSSPEFSTDSPFGHSQARINGGQPSFICHLPAVCFTHSLDQHTATR